MKRTINFTIKRFIWDHFVYKYYKSWLEEYAEERNYVYEPEYEDLRYDLD